MPSFSCSPKLLRAFIIVTFSVFIAYCFKNVNIIIRMKQKGTCIYIMPLNDIVKNINEESNKQINKERNSGKLLTDVNKLINTLSIILL